MKDEKDKKQEKKFLFMRSMALITLFCIAIIFISIPFLFTSYHDIFKTIILVAGIITFGFWIPVFIYGLFFSKER